jgi:diguanylate cyclase (GGDEF)-like protein
MEQSPSQPATSLRTPARVMACLLPAVGAAGLAAWLWDSVLPAYRPDLIFPDPRWSLAVGLAIGAAAWWLTRRFAGLAAQETQPNSLTPLETTPGIHALLPRRTVAPVTRIITPGLNVLIQGQSAADAVLLKTHRDELTGLWTRDYFNLLSDRLSQGGMDPEASFCVLCVDVSGFDQVNDRYGAEAAQHVLVQVAKRLRHMARSQDLVFRLSGDSFMLLLSCPIAEGQALARNVSNRVLSDLQRPLSYRTLSNLRVYANVGAALCPANGATLTEVMQHADEALHAAKDVGLGQFRQFVGQAQQQAAA